jgi:hypothetical protein
MGKAVANTGLDAQKSVFPETARGIQGKRGSLGGGGGCDTVPQQPFHHRRVTGFADGVEGMSMLQTVLGTATVAAIGSLVVSAVLPEPPNLPIDYVSLEYRTNTIALERYNRTGADMRAPRATEVIRADNEQEVPECRVDGWSDFRITEPTTQVWKRDVILSESCQRAMEVGVEYDLIFHVLPTNGPGDQVRTSFIWKG